MELGCHQVEKGIKRCIVLDKKFRCIYCIPNAWNNNQPCA